MAIIKNFDLSFRFVFSKISRNIKKFSLFCQGNWPLEWFAIQISSRCLIHLVFPVAYAKLFLSKCLSKHCWTFTCYTKFFAKNLPCLLFYAFFVVYFLQLSLIGRKSHVKRDYLKIAETEKHSCRELF